MKIEAGKTKDVQLTVQLKDLAVRAAQDAQDVQDAQGETELKTAGFTPENIDETWGNHRTYP